MLQKTTKVITASGKRVPKSSCCTIDGEFYIKNEEAVRVGLDQMILEYSLTIVQTLGEKQEE